MSQETGELLPVSGQPDTSRDISAVYRDTRYPIVCISSRDHVSTSDREIQSDIPLGQQQRRYQAAIWLRHHCHHLCLLCLLLSKLFSPESGLCAGGHKVGAGSGHGDTVWLSPDIVSNIHVIMSYFITELSKNSNQSKNSLKVKSEGKYDVSIELRLFLNWKFVTWKFFTFF